MPTSPTPPTNTPRSQNPILAAVWAWIKGWLYKAIWLIVVLFALFALIWFYVLPRFNGENKDSTITAQHTKEVFEAKEKAEELQKQLDAIDAAAQKANADNAAAIEAAKAEAAKAQATLRDRDREIEAKANDAKMAREQLEAGTAKAEADAKASIEATRKTAEEEIAKAKATAKAEALANPEIAGVKVWQIGNGVHADFDQQTVKYRKGPEKVYPDVEGRGALKEGIYPILAADGNPLKDTGAEVNIKGAHVLSVKTKRGYEKYWFVQ